MKRARFIAAARLEFLAEVIYHSDAEPGLGERFTAAVEKATARALAFPLSGTPSRSKTRKIVVKGFRFSVFYRPESEGIVSLQWRTIRGGPTTGSPAHVPAHFKCNGPPAAPVDYRRWASAKTGCARFRMRVSHGVTHEPAEQ